MLERPRCLKAKKAQAMLLDSKLWGPACHRQAVGRVAPVDTQTPHRGAGGTYTHTHTHNTWAMLLTGTKPLAWRKLFTSANHENDEDNDKKYNSQVPRFPIKDNGAQSRAPTPLL